MVDLWPQPEAAVRRNRPRVYQHLMQHVKPERDRNNRDAYRRRWWWFGEPRPELRQALRGLPRYIVTVETAKHRWFRFLDAEIAPDNKLIVVASADAALLAMLNSRPHLAWFLRHAGRIGVYADEAVYVKSVCFDAFPFPDLDDDQRRGLVEAGEELDGLRARVLAADPALTMTGLYNVISDLRRGRPLTAEQTDIRSRGCVDVLMSLHDRIDALTIAAYGWGPELGDAALVRKLHELHARRRSEETAGQVRWLDGRRPAQGVQRVRPPLLPLAADQPAPPPPAQPEILASVLLSELRQAGRPVQPASLARRFQPGGPRLVERIEDTLAILAAAGAAARTDAGWFAPRRGL
ncbi:type IIL restriction-modification enzyme MmeI [Brevundimonas balnearis]|uniref:Type IIL restriction-modification enzyme MmeI n=1 Tax=Brevundimonas balnearis TaxID=1572858 RepID=A0ABV6R177_9CAUL